MSENTTKVNILKEMYRTVEELRRFLGVPQDEVEVRLRLKDGAGGDEFVHVMTMRAESLIRIMLDEHLVGIEAGLKELTRAFNNLDDRPRVE